ncbi:hexitol phosphatase HxpB [bacterium]|nr:hexitol phosphatase HxpB [bacterium]
MIDAVIFDMDGVLIDSEPFWRIALQETFARVGINMTESLAAQTMGIRIDEVVKYWHKRFPWNGLSVSEVESQIVDRVQELVVQKGEMLAGVRQTLDFFHKKNLPLALASSSPQRLIQTVVGHLHIVSDFKIIHSGELEPYGKPHPAIFLTAAKLLNCDPTHCLVIEDSFNGLIAAKAARMKTICIPEHASFSQTRFDIADIKLKSLNELSEKIFASLNQH